MGQGLMTDPALEEALHVLLVEDDPVMRHAVGRALHTSAEDVRIHEEENGESAITLLGSAQFDCIFLDYQLPGMDGLEVLRWLRREPGLRLLRVVMLTASQDPRDSSAAYKLGAHSYLTKPTDFNEAVAMLARLLIPFVPIAANPELPPKPPTTASDGPAM